MSYEISDEEKLKIAVHFMLSSPPGEINEVLTDVRVLLDNDNLLNQTALSAFREYNKSQMFATELPELDYPLLITEYGELSPNTYLDPRSKRVYSFDHIQQTFSGEFREAENSEIFSAVEDYRSAIDMAINQYVFEYFADHSATVYEQKGKEIVICISAKKYSPQNYWNGTWRSVWKINIKNGKTKMKGTIKTLVHLYEAGNVQLNTLKEESVDVTVSDPESTGTSIAKAIFETEHKYQKALQLNYLEMGDTTFKSLRRKLPITGEKVNFYNIYSKKIIGETSSGKK
ncbi:f-actin-capping protein subunit alpha [Anaeramoeba flamelloides]|uniref:F-actin-capping protein subunit alpha n=1 Tax=Anaeramoeba flamelloides TaxID=1746091 RepID=A0AAV7ZC09_9EUKA|nr:f-actin-capping protein subunit alpha [Anaeramoeba flamelloides]KAJ6251144.1 f-actin-capping protein subunit alpha [Anaeramoeba flamelloides]